MIIPAHHKRPNGQDPGSEDDTTTEADSENAERVNDSGSVVTKGDRNSSTNDPIEIDSSISESDDEGEDEETRLGEAFSITKKYRH
jgi:hypothetical protein